MVWEYLYNAFKFKPSISEFPSFIVPSPFVTYDISAYLNFSGDLEEYEKLYKDLEDSALHAFQKLMNENQYFYALDWQHSCYWVNPYLGFPRDEFNEWLIPIFPNGDYYFFIEKEYNWGFLGHPWEKSITVFGKDLIQEFESNKPRMFNSILRRG